MDEERGLLDVDQAVQLDRDEIREKANELKIW
jgi:hypothetical protein